MKNNDFNQSMRSLVIFNIVYVACILLTMFIDMDTPLNKILGTILYTSGILSAGVHLFEWRCILKNLKSKNFYEEE